MKKTILLLIILSCSLANGQFWENPNQKPSLFGIRINRGHILGDPVSCWLFNEGSGDKVFDLSGNGNEMNFISSPIWTSGKHGSAILFDDALSQHLKRSNAIITDYPFTLAGWFNSNDGAKGQCIVGFADRATTTNNWRLLAMGSVAGNPVRFRSHTTGGGTVDADTTTGFTVNTWHFAVAVGVSATERHVYIDGGGKGTNTTSSLPAGLDNTTIGILHRPTLINAFSGKIGHVMIYNRALSASEIALLYREPSCFMEPLWDWNLYFGMSFAPPGAGQFIFINQ